MLANGNIAHIHEGGSHTYSTDKVGIGALVNISTPRVLVILLQGSEDITDTHTHGTEAVGVNNHLVLLEFAPEAIDFGYALGAIELAGDNPVLHGAEVFGRIFVLALLGGTNNILIYLAQSCTHGGEFGGAYASGNLLLGFLEFLTDQLTSKIDVHILCKDGRNDRETKAGNTTSLLQARDIGNGLLNRESNELFYLL